MKTGAVILDDNTAPKSGWCAEAGEAARYVEDIVDLPNDCVWVLDADWADMDAYGLTRHARFRANRYLGITFLRVLEELVSPSVDNARAVEVMANVFERLVALTQRHVFDDSREMWRPHLLSLAKSVREEILPVDPDFRDQKHQLLVAALMDSRQEFSRTQVHIPKGNVFVPLRISRVEHAINVINEVVIPFSEEYEWVKGPFPKTEDAQMDWLIGFNDAPLLVEAVVSDFRRDVADIFNLGGRVSSKAVRKTGQRVRNVAGNRTWLTAYDMMLLAPFAKIEIKRALVFKKYGRLRALKVMDEYASIIEDGPPALRASWSLGMLGQLLWASACLENPPNVTARKNELVSENPIAPFIRSVDRSFCLRKALDLHLEGVPVAGYSTGTVFASLPNDDMLRFKAYQFAVTGKLLPYMCDATDPRLQDYLDDLEDFAHVDADPVWKNIMKVLGRGEWKEWQEFDKKAVDIYLNKLDEMRSKENS